MDYLIIPHNKVQAYNIQSIYEVHSTSKLFGWKIAATSEEGQKHIGVNGPIAGRLLEERLNSSGASISLEKNKMKKVEAEFAFKLSRDIKPKSEKYLMKDVLDYVEGVCPAIEIPDSRFLNFDKIGDNLLIADNACAGDFILGDNFLSNIQDIDFKNFKVSCYKNNELASRGLGSNVLGDPLIAINWIINELSSLGIVCKKGQVIITGTCIKPLTVKVGDYILMDFYDLGSVECKFV